MEETKYWLWLNMVFGTGNHRIWEVMSFFRTAEKAYISLTSDSGIVSLNDSERKNVNAIPLRNAEIFLANCAKRGIGAAAFTAVGTRKATPYSLKAAKEICSELSARGAVIISGFAVGIDLASHMAAADIGRPTVCVMGCGVDVDYPKPNFRYRDTILAAGGVFISEFPPGTPPNSPNFPKRNRILAALGAAAVVFQAGAKSGSLITANLAAGQGREVLCLPPADIFSGEFAGNVKLLRDGAVPMYDASDVMDSITGKKKLSAETSAVRRGAEVFGERREPSADELNDFMRVMNGIDDVKKDSAEITEQPELSDELSETQRRIAMELSEGPLHADELAQRLVLDPSELMTELTELEIFGTVRSLPGKMFELIR